MKSTVASDEATWASTAACSGPPIIFRKSMLFSSLVRLVDTPGARSSPLATAEDTVSVATRVTSCAVCSASGAGYAASLPPRPERAGLFRPSPPVCALSSLSAISWLLRAWVGAGHPSVGAGRLLCRLRAVLLRAVPSPDPASVSSASSGRSSRSAGPGRSPPASVPGAPTAYAPGVGGPSCPAPDVCAPRSGTGPDPMPSVPADAPPACTDSWSSGTGTGPSARPVPAPAVAAVPVCPPVVTVTVTCVDSLMVRSCASWGRSDHVSGRNQPGGVDVDVHRAVVREGGVEQDGQVGAPVRRALLDPLPAGAAVEVRPGPLAPGVDERREDLLVVLPGHDCSSCRDGWVVRRRTSCR
ncbi:hypothetical protein [Ornithinimicrobium kibberense]|uniref:hypothetical protein n=1 Tax=Ornithinimicrobium kibberense TaxID=282060 RepID=UPI0036103D03